MQAKREARALRNAKNSTKIKGKFEDAFCDKALNNVMDKVI